MALFTYSPGSDIGNVRLIISDNDSQNFVFNDDEIQQFVNLTAVDGDTDVRLASAMALETLAASEARVQKKISMHDLSTDGPALAKSLRDAAKALRDEVENDIAFDWAERSHNVWSTYQIIVNRELRQN